MSSQLIASTRAMRNTELFRPNAVEYDSSYLWIIGTVELADKSSKSWRQVNLPLETCRCQISLKSTELIQNISSGVHVRKCTDLVK